MGSNTTVSIDAYDHAVSSVVVFRNQAEVFRIFPVQLKTGNNEIEITHLPRSMLYDSLRVEGLGKGVTIVDHATHSRSAGPFSFGPKKHESKKLKELLAIKKAAQSQLYLINAQSDIFIEYAKSMKAENIGPDEFTAFMTILEQAGSTKIEAYQKKEKEIEEIEAEIQKERDAPQNSEDQENERKTSVSVVVKAEADVNAELKLIYVVTAASWQPNYEIRATTDPNGQLAKQVTLHYRAAISQTSGEDWKNSIITLSTNQPSFTQTIRPNRGLKVGPAPGAGYAKPNPIIGGLFGNQANNVNVFGGPALQQQQQQMQPQQQQLQLMHQQQMHQQQRPQFAAPAPAAPSLFGGSGAFGASSTVEPLVPQPTAFGFGQPIPPAASLFGSAIGSASPLAAPPPPPAASPRPPSPPKDEPFSYASAVAETNALNATYKIEGKTTIPSDRAMHKVAISMSTVLPIDVYVVTVPRTQPFAYLQATIKNTTKEPLLTGSAMVFNDESYVGSAAIPLTSAQESFTCSLGVDNKVRVSFAHTKEAPITSNFAFAGNVESMSSKNVMKVKNTRGVAIAKIIVRDSVPVATDPFKVILKTPEGLATTTDRDVQVKLGDDGKVVARWSKEKPSSREEGLVEWVIQDLGSGEEKQVELTWTVENPPNLKWAYVNV